MILTMSGRTLWRSHLLPFIATRPLRQLVLGAGALLLLVSGLFGGLARAEPDEIETLKAGRTVETAPFDVTVTRAGWTTDLGETLGKSEVGRFLVVYATIRSTEKQSVDGFVVGEAIRIRGLKGFPKYQGDADELVVSDEAKPKLVVRDDQVTMDALNPGLTYELAYIWEQTDDAPVPRTVDLTVYDHSFRQSSLDEQENWWDTFEMATGSFPLTEIEP